MSSLKEAIQPLVAGADLVEGLQQVGEALNPLQSSGAGQSQGAGHGAMQGGDMQSLAGQLMQAIGQLLQSSSGQNSGGGAMQMPGARKWRKYGWIW